MAHAFSRTAFRTVLAAAGLLALAGCGGEHRLAEIPLSGVNGNTGGSDVTVYTGTDGRQYFHS